LVNVLYPCLKHYNKKKKKKKKKKSFVRTRVYLLVYCFISSRAYYNACQIVGTKISKYLMTAYPVSLSSNYKYTKSKGHFLSYMNNCQPSWVFACRCCKSLTYLNLYNLHTNHDFPDEKMKRKIKWLNQSTQLINSRART
jgi:hypothetical protein